MPALTGVRRMVCGVGDNQHEGFLRENSVKGVTGMKHKVVIFVTFFLVIVAGSGRPVAATEPVPTILDPTLGVRTVVSDLSQPTSMAFLGADDLLVLEKRTGKVQRVVNGVVASTPPLDLAVNSASERGLL